MLRHVLAVALELAYSASDVGDARVTLGVSGSVACSGLVLSCCLFLR